MTEGDQASFVRRPASLRRVRNGVRLRREDPDRGGWVARRWLERLMELVPARERGKGLEYARLGQTVSLEVTPGAVVARVQGRGSKPYGVRWRVPVLSRDQWQRVVHAMAGEAIYAAKLMARELPETIEPLLESLDLTLLPAPDTLVVECDCPAPQGCKHAAAVAYLVAERLDNDPLEVFTLRGLPGDRLLQRIAGARAGRTRGPALAHAEPLEPPASEHKPLEKCLDTFWRHGPQLAALQHIPPPAHAPHALLRRLGPSPMPGRFPLVGLLASVYDTVAERAIHLRDHAERIDDSPNPQPPDP